MSTDTHSKAIGYILWLLTGGIFGAGYIYDFFTLNEQISLKNSLG